MPNRVGVAQIWHWLALTGIKTQRTHKTNNLPTLLSGSIWHWQASAGSYYNFSMVQIMVSRCSGSAQRSNTMPCVSSRSWYSYSSASCPKFDIQEYIKFDIITVVKDVRFVGGSLDDLRHFPAGARREAGFELSNVQAGLLPSDSKPMNTVGAGVFEIRIKDKTGIYQVIYVARFEEAI